MSRQRLCFSGHAPRRHHHEHQPRKPYKRCSAVFRQPCTGLTAVTVSSLARLQAAHAGSPEKQPERAAPLYWLIL